MGILRRVCVSSSVDQVSSAVGERSGGVRNWREIGRCRTSAAVALTTALACSAACATSSTARLVTTDSQSESGFSTDILSIDEREPTRANLELAPGRHVVKVVGTSRRVGVNASAGMRGAAVGAGLVSPLFGAGAALAGWADATHSVPMKACFITRPGRTYEVRTFIEGQVWNIQVVDQTTTYDVKSPCKKKPAARPGN
jgi:hypothetical protein